MAQALSIFNFLKEYNELSNPVITELGAQPWSLNLSDLPRIKEIKSVFSSEDVNSLSILEVNKPVIEPCPYPENFLHEWLERDWKKLSVDKVRYKETITREIINSEGDVSYREERFEEDPSRVEAYNKWSAKREQWREVEIPREKGLLLYNNLFKLYSDIKKESESVEFILGDGILAWQTAGRNIEHPLLLQKVSLDFDPETPQFTIKCEEIKTELYTSMLRVIPSINQSMLSEIIQDVESNAYSIADLANTVPLFKRLINVIDKNGSFAEDNKTLSDHAQIFSSPVIFLRKRTLGYSAFLENIINEIKEKGEGILPEFFETMVGNHKEADKNIVIEEAWNQSGIDQDILLTLPANSEQLKIIKYLEAYGAVLVQGPPGTGKTHTIGNLIGHLLSQGNSVLVTSHKEKALTVLKDKVYKDPNDKDVNLQSLCISLLSSKSQKKEMDEAINEIAIKGTSLDLNEAKKKIVRLEAERKSLIEAFKDKNEELIHIRSLEYKDIIYDNKTITPIEASKFIRLGIGSLDYIEGKTSDDTIGLPMNLEDLRTLYETNETITAFDEKVLSNAMPDLQRLWDVKAFIEKKGFLERLEEDLDNSSSSIMFQDSVDEETIKALLGQSKRIASELQSADNLEKALINRSIIDPTYRKLWSDIIIEIEQLLEAYEKIRKIKLEEEFDISEALSTEDTLIALQEIIDTGKETPISLFTALTKPKWKAVKEGIKNKGKAIEKRREFIVAYELINYELDRSKLLTKVNKLLTEVDNGAIIEKDNFEIKIKQYNDKVVSALSWYEEKWRSLLEEYKKHVADRHQFETQSAVDLNSPLLSITSFLEEMLLNINRQMTKFELSKIQEEWKSFTGYVCDYKNSSPLVDELICAVENKDSKAYEEALNKLLEIFSKNEKYNIRKKLLSQLEDVAPEWAKAIEARRGIHGSRVLPDNLEQAWKWRQLNNQIERIDAIDPNKLQKAIDDINNKLLVNARILAYEKAWYEKISNRTAAQAQAIEGWRTTMKQIGKATGKHAPALMKKARELMPLCQSAIPVWIMPLNRVVENFDPSKNKFDVVIIDEASQSDILALAALCLGKKIIIVGDDEQVSPDSVGMKKDEIDALIEQYLQGIPNNFLFNGQTSLYDMAKTSGFKPLMLTEHFRCLPEIIEFSNRLSYNGKIKPLRDASHVKIKPPVVEYRVPEAYRTSGKVNKIEAEHIASLICACTEISEYKGKSIGVISLLGTEQSYEIDRYLQQHMDPVEYEKREIQCGSPSQFQGDERDIIFLSVVEGPSTKGGPVRLLSEEGNNDLARKRYNVAASRAKDQMWVVHSLNPEIDLKPEDIRLRLINHAINPYFKEEERILNMAESPFEAEVMKALLNKNYCITPQVKVGAYRIDMVIEDGDRRIALECDGGRWHTQEDLPNDLKRQAILERLGWKFIRIRGSVFYRNPDAAIDEVVKELEYHGIKPNYHRTNENQEEAESQNNELVEMVKRRAEEIRRSWHKENESDEETDAESGEEILEKAGLVNEKNPVEYMEIQETMLINEADSVPKQLGIFDFDDMPQEKEKNDRPLFDFRKKKVQEKTNEQKNVNDENIVKSGSEQNTEVKEANDKQKPRFDFRNKKQKQ